MAKLDKLGPIDTKKDDPSGISPSINKLNIAAGARDRIRDSIDGIKAIQQSVCTLANGHIVQIDTLEKIPLVEFDDATKSVVPIDVGKVPLADVDNLLETSIKALNDYMQIKVAEAQQTQGMITELQSHLINIKRALSTP
jgi:ABC-type methionine transport system ATPase subunit